MSDTTFYDDDGDDLADIDRPPSTQTEQLLRRLLDVVATARPVPLSTSAMVNKDELIALVEEALHAFPKEVRESRWLLKERDAYLDKARKEAEDILAASTARAARMIVRSELVRAAEARARHVVDVAEAEARRMRLEVEDYCDQKLGSFEIVLERTMRLVAAGREKLQLQSRPLSNGHGPSDAPAEATAADAASGMFDQDRT
jgi:cell division septum initiation protein DivIVA